MGEDTGNNNPEEHQEEQVSPSLDQDVVATPVVVQQEQPTAPSVAAPEFAPAAGAVVPSVKQLNPITLVLQWLTYAFWGWFALAMLWLSYVSFAFFTDPSGLGDDWSSIVPYPIAAVVVLFLMAGATDLFYMRREPAHKTGVATAIMVIHTVIFALCGVGLIVSVVFILLQMMLNASPDPSLFAMLYMALIGVLLYVILVARTTLVAKLKRIPIIAMGSLGVIALLFVVLCVVGPMMKSIATKQDRQIESALPALQTLVEDYTRDNKKLPASLDDLVLTGQVGSISSADVKALIHKGAIEYTSDVKPVSEDSDSLSSNSYSQSATMVHYYQLCATYVASKGNDATLRYRAASDSYDYGSDSNSSSNSDYLDTYAHEKGKQCYKLQAISNYTPVVRPMPLKN